jgi:hypothetical protein
MIFKTLEKIRRSSLAVRQRFTMLVTIIFVGIVTLIWFVFFTASFLSHHSQNNSVPSAPAEATTTAQ